MRLWAAGSAVIRLHDVPVLGRDLRWWVKDDREVGAPNGKWPGRSRSEVWLLPKELDHDDGEVTATLGAEGEITSCMERRLRGYTSL